MCLWWLRVIDMCMYIIAVSTVVCTFPLRKVREGILIDVITSCLDLERRTNQKLLEMTPDWPLALHHQTPEELDCMRFESDEGWGRWENMGGGREEGKNIGCGSERKKNEKQKARFVERRQFGQREKRAGMGKVQRERGRWLGTYPDSLLKGKHKRSSS